MGRTSTRSAEAEPPGCSAHSRVNHTPALLRDRAQSLPGRAPVTAAFPQRCPVPRRALAAVPKRDTLHPIPLLHPQERRELNRQQESRSRCVHPPPAGPLRAAGALRGAGLRGGRRGAAGREGSCGSGKVLPKRLTAGRTREVRARQKVCWVMA